MRTLFSHLSWSMCCVCMWANPSACRSHCKTLLWSQPLWSAHPYGATGMESHQGFNGSTSFTCFASCTLSLNMTTSQPTGSGDVSWIPQVSFQKGKIRVEWTSDTHRTSDGWDDAPKFHHRLVVSAPTYTQTGAPSVDHNQLRHTYKAQGSKDQGWNVG